VLSATDEVEVNFTADVVGEYDVELVVTQGELVSGAAVVGVTVSEEIIVAPPACGDGNLDEGEECDYGDSIPGDSCNADCTDPLPGSICGNGSVEVGEECDGIDGCTDECTLEEEVVLPSVSIVQGVAGLSYSFDASGLVPGVSIVSATIAIPGLLFDPVTQTFTIGVAPAPGMYTGTLLLSNGELYEITWEILPVDLFIVPEGISKSLLITTLVGDVLSGDLTITGNKYYDVVYVINAVLLANP
jgi:cysteine-rich repeat protein